MRVAGGRAPFLERQRSRINRKHGIEKLEQRTRQLGADVLVEFWNARRLGWRDRPACAFARERHAPAIGIFDQAGDLELRSIIVPGPGGVLVACNESGLRQCRRLMSTDPPPCQRIEDRLRALADSVEPSSDWRPQRRARVNFLRPK